MTDACAVDAESEDGVGDELGDAGDRHRPVEELLTPLPRSTSEGFPSSSPGVARRMIRSRPRVTARAEVGSPA